MKNKLFTIFAVICFLFTGMLKAQAVITSEYELEAKLNLVNELARYDFSSLINKNELIGYRLTAFEMNTQYYVNNVYVAADTLTGILDQINILKNSSEVSDTEKSMQISRLFNEADTVLRDLDSKTVTYVMDLKKSIPTVTYSTYSRKLLKYYNSLQLSGVNMELAN